MTTVRIVKHYGSLNRGETAGYSDEEAERLIAAGIAESIEPKKVEAAVAVEVSPDQHVEHPKVENTSGVVTEPTPVGRKADTKR